MGHLNTFWMRNKNKELQSGDRRYGKCTSGEGSCFHREALDYQAVVRSFQCWSEAKARYSDVRAETICGFMLQGPQGRGLTFRGPLWLMGGRVEKAGTKRQTEDVREGKVWEKIESFMNPLDQHKGEWRGARAENLCPCLAPVVSLRSSELRPYGLLEWVKCGSLVSGCAVLLNWLIEALFYSILWSQRATYYASQRGLSSKLSYEGNPVSYSHSLPSECIYIWSND